MHYGSLKPWVLRCVAGMGLLYGNETFATVLSFSANLEYSGGTSPVGAAPWLTATFDDHGGTGSVTMTLAATNLTASEFVSRWYLNLNPTLDPTKLNFNAPTKVGEFDLPSISLGKDKFKAGGSDKYDVQFQFATAGVGTGRFDKANAVTYTISGISSLTANSFNYLSVPTGGNKAFSMAAHVQAIGACGDGSGWVTNGPVPPSPPPVPEPATIGFLALGGIALVFRRRR